MRFSVWPRMKSAVDEIIGLEYCDVNKSELTITLPNGNMIACVGCDDPEKLKSIEGFTDVWIEEATELDEADVETIDAGLSADVDPPASIAFTFNPIPISEADEVEHEAFEPEEGDDDAMLVNDPRHWLQRRFGLEEIEYDKLYIEDDVCLLRTWFMSNRWCPEANKKLLLSYRKTNKDLWEMWGLGKFITLKGAILKNWDVVEQPPDRAPDVYGLDFGFANDPTALVAIWESKGEPDVVQELLYATGLTNQALSTEMQALGVDRRIPIYAENAEPKSIQELKDLKWRVLPCLKGPDFKRAAAKFINSKLTHITRDSVNLKREATSWAWKRNRKTGKTLPIPSDGNDHTTDAWIYAKYRQRVSQFKAPDKPEPREQALTAGVRDKRW